MRIRFLATPVAFLLFAIAAPASSPSPVAVIEDAPWSPGDAPRDGAAEFGVLLRLAQLQREHALVGLVGVGDRRGRFQEGTRRGLEFAVQQGCPVVRLARGTPAAVPSEDDVFIDGGPLSPQAAADLLAHCLQRFGPLPKENASPVFREQLARYQAEFNARQPSRIAMR